MRIIANLGLLLSCLALIPSSQLFHTSCGDRIDVHRTLSMGIGGIMPVHINTELLSLQKRDALHPSMLVISIRGHCYSSMDGGKSFVRMKNEIGCLKYPTDLDGPGVCVQSSSDPKTVYRPARNGQHGSDLELSRDNGRSWIVMHPRTSKGRHFGSIRIVGTSERMAGRIYAIASAVGESGAYVSEDYGHTYRQVSSYRVFIFESRSLPNVLYSVAMDGINVTMNSGRTWNLMPNTKEMISPVYIDSSGDNLQTWKDRDHNRGIDGNPNIIQIETDPNNKNIFYVLSYKGLYRSLDAGNSFVLLPLAKDLICEIQKIAVDPIDGRFLYAAVGKNSLFKSSDYGCSWHELNLPK